MNDWLPTVERLVARAGQLYTLPAVAMQVLELTRDPHVDTRALKECIEKDPAMASRVLRVVNSSLFSLRREVSDLNQALAHLGVKPLKILVLGFSLPSALFFDVESQTLGWYWRHALTKAVAARELSQRIWHLRGDDAFLAGLLQDLGILVLLQQIGKPYARLLDRTVARQVDLVDLETRTMGFSHTCLTARLLATWNLPSMLVESIAGDGDEVSVALCQILHLAESLAQFVADGNQSALRELIAAARTYSRVLEPQLEPLLGDLEIQVRELADILALQLPEGKDYRDVRAEAHRQLAALATETAMDLVRSGNLSGPASDDDRLAEDMAHLTQAISLLARRPGEASPSDAPTARIDVGTGATGGHGAPASSTATAVLEKPQAAAVAAQPTAKPMAIPPDFVERLTSAVTACRRAGCPLSLLLVRYGRAHEILTGPGAQEFAKAQILLEHACRSLDNPRIICVPYANAAFALILPDCDRQQAVALGNDLIAALRRRNAPPSEELGELYKLDVGVATVAHPPRNFPAKDLLDGADRCLYASQTFGMSMVKSIEIY